MKLSQLLYLCTESIGVFELVELKNVTSFWLISYIYISACTNAIIQLVMICSLSWCSHPYICMCLVVDSAIMLFLVFMVALLFWCSILINSPQLRNACLFIETGSLKLNEQSCSRQSDQNEFFSNGHTISLYIALSCNFLTFHCKASQKFIPKHCRYAIVN